MRKNRWLILSVLILLISRPAFGVFIAGQEFVPEHTEGKTLLKLTGAALNRFQVTRVYAVGLYADKKADPKDVLNFDVAKRVDVVFLQNIKRDDVLEEFTTIMEDAVDAEMYAHMKDRITRMKKYFFDMEMGDRLSVTFLPDFGSRFELNGTKLVTIEGGDFAFAYFSIFIGMKPMDVRGKSKLLGSGR